MSTSATMLDQDFSLQRTYQMFRYLGLSHITVVNLRHQVLGVITRKDLLPYNIQDKVAALAAAPEPPTSDPDPEQGEVTQLPGTSGGNSSQDSGQGSSAAEDVSPGSSGGSEQGSSGVGDGDQGTSQDAAVGEENRNAHKNTAEAPERSATPPPEPIAPEENSASTPGDLDSASGLSDRSGSDGEEAGGMRRSPGYEDLREPPGSAPRTTDENSQDHRGDAPRPESMG